MPSHYQFLFWSLTSIWVGLRAELVTPSTESPEPFPWNNVRLPTTVRPDRYFIHIHPDLHTKTFVGQVHIFLTALSQTDFIILNSKHLTISNASLTHLTVRQDTLIQNDLREPQARPDQQEFTGTQVKLKQKDLAKPIFRPDQQGTVTPSPSHEQITVHESKWITEKHLLPHLGRQRDRTRHLIQPSGSPSRVSVPQHLSVRVLESESLEQLAVIVNSTLIVGHEYQLTLSFSGAFSSGLNGLYTASYQTPSGTTRFIATTHFEPSSAREVFPCFDEPSMKAVFSLRIVRDRELTSLSNMPQVFSRMRADGLVEDQFLTSVKMSTYLVAFVICDFDHRSAKTNRGVEVSVFAASHKIEQTNRALKAAVQILDFYEDYFQIPYPLPKLDLVAVPEFEAGAMENWGLVIFRETALLCDSNSTDLRQRFWISVVIAHELTHQWFGNLVTPRWWRDLWLNEGFASYMEYISLEQLHSDWNVEDQQLLSSSFIALEKDSFMTSHPVSRPINTPTQIREMFDVISYSKGASVIQMLHTYLSDTVFVGGIRLYLKKHSYSNAQTDDLWNSLTEVSQQSGDGVDVKALMNSWIRQTGYPVVSVKTEGTKMQLRQEPFTNLPQEDSEYLWQIPFTFYTSDSSSVTTYLLKNREGIVDLPQAVLWIKANVNSSGFYRVWYDRPLLKALFRCLKDSSSFLNPADRAGLIDDIFQLARQGKLQYTDALTFSTYLKNEREYLPIKVFLNHMNKMILQFRFGKQSCIARLLKDHVWSMLGEQAKEEPWEEAETLEGQNRRALLLDLGVKSSLAIQQTATRLFYFWMARDGKHPLPWSLRALVWRLGIWKGGQPEWDFLLQQYQRSWSSTERVALLLALCNTADEKKREWLLRTALQGHIIKTQDLALVVEQLASWSGSSDMVWGFLRNNWDQLLMKFPLGSSYLSSIVTSVTSHFNSSQKFDEVRDFFVKQRNLGHLQFVRRSLETIQMNILWLKTNTKAIESWLKRAYPVNFKAYTYCRKDVTYRFRWGTTIRIKI